MDTFSNRYRQDKAVWNITFPVAINGANKYAEDKTYLYGPLRIEVENGSCNDEKKYFVAWETIFCKRQATLHAHMSKLIKPVLQYWMLGYDVAFL